MLNLEVLKFPTFTLTTVINMVVYVKLYGDDFITNVLYKIYVVSQH